MKTISEQDGTKPKSKGGRPKKAGRKSTVLVVRMTPAERAVIENKASEARVKTAEWIRMAAINAVIKARFTKEEIGLLRSLAGLNNNLNQLTRLAHQEGITSVIINIRTLLKEISVYLDKLKSDDRKVD